MFLKDYVRHRGNQLCAITFGGVFFCSIHLSLHARNIGYGHLQRFFGIALVCHTFRGHGISVPIEFEQHRGRQTNGSGLWNLHGKKEGEKVKIFLCKSHEIYIYRKIRRRKSYLPDMLFGLNRWSWNALWRCGMEKMVFTAWTTTTSTASCSKKAPRFLRWQVEKA